MTTLAAKSGRRVFAAQCYETPATPRQVNTMTPISLTPACAGHLLEQTGTGRKGRFLSSAVSASHGLLQPTLHMSSICCT